MKGLLLKDWYTLTRQLKVILGMMVLFSIVPGYSAISFVLVYAAMLPVTALAYDERSKWDELAAMMPYSVRQLVAGKYILGAGFIGAAVLISAVSQSIMGLVRGDIQVQEMLLTICLTALLAFVLMSVNLPVMYAVGVEKGRILFMLVCGAIVAVGIGISNWITPLLDGMTLSAVPFLVIPVVTAAVVFGSMEISVRVYRRRKEK